MTLRKTIIIITVTAFFVCHSITLLSQDELSHKVSIYVITLFSVLIIMIVTYYCTDENDLMLVLFPISDGLKSKKKKFSLYPILEILCYSGLMLFLCAQNSFFFRNSVLLYIYFVLWDFFVLVSLPSYF